MNDLISRQAAIDATWKEPSYTDPLNVLTEVRERIEALPSVQSKAIRPKFVAEDRYVKNYFTTYPHCPKCNYGLETGDCYCKVCGCHIDWSEDDE